MSDGNKQKHLPRINTEIRPRISRSVCHGLTRNYTEISRSISHGWKNKQKHLPRKQNTAFRAGCVSDGSFLRRRTQLFIAYLYKPEAQAKVFQIHVYYSHIIPSLALQACKTRNTLKSRFPNPQLIVNKRTRAPFDKLRDRDFFTVIELAELAVKFRAGQKYLSTSP